MAEEVAFVGMGTNAGDRLRNLMVALERIEMQPQIELEQVSSIYETEPVGVIGSSRFLNAVCSVRTSLAPKMLLRLLESIEKEMGRSEKGELRPRIIDLDLLLHGTFRMDEEGLELPHPRLHLRRFVLVPMCEIAPGAFHPVLKKTMHDILLDLEDGNGVRFYSRFPD